METAQGDRERRRAGRARSCRAASRMRARGRVQLSMRLVEGEFPGLPPGDPGEVGAHRWWRSNASLLAALRRVSIVSSERTRGVKLQLEAQTARDLARSIRTSARPPRRSRSSTTATPFSIGFNARYLIDVLAVLPADKRSRDRPQRRGEPGRHALRRRRRLLLCRDADAALNRRLRTASTRDAFERPSAGADLAAAHKR